MESLPRTPWCIFPAGDSQPLAAEVVRLRKPWTANDRILTNPATRFGWGRRKGAHNSSINRPRVNAAGFVVFLES